LQGFHRKKREWETHKWERKGHSFEKKSSNVLRDDRKEKGRLTKWERKGQRKAEESYSNRVPSPLPVLGVNT